MFSVFLCLNVDPSQQPFVAQHCVAGKDGKHGSARDTARNGQRHLPSPFGARQTWFAHIHLFLTFCVRLSPLLPGLTLTFHHCDGFHTPDRHFLIEISFDYSIQISIMLSLRPLMGQVVSKSRALVTTVLSRSFGNIFQRPRVVILGSGWAGNTLARRLQKKKFDVRMISPSNHFLFTPLLPSTAVGTLEFRAIQEPGTTRRIILLLDVYHAPLFDFRCSNLKLTPGISLVSHLVLKQKYALSPASNITKPRP